MTDYSRHLLLKKKKGDSFMSRSTVNPDVIKWGIERAGLQIDMLKNKFPKLESWLDGEKPPTYKQLKDLAQKIRLPIGYLFLEQIPDLELPVPFYRTYKTGQSQTPSPELIDTIFTMQRRQIWLREYQIENAQPKLPFVRSAKAPDDVTHIVASIRDTLGLAPNWAQQFKSWREALNHLIKSINEAGVLVMVNGVVGNNTHRPLNPQEFRGFVLVDDYAPLIFVNGADTKAAQMFTLTHELAHIWLGLDGVFDLEGLQPADDEDEILCNKVAAEFLVPEEDLLKQWKQIRKNDDAAIQLARIYKVSEIVLQRRLLDLKLISKNEFFDFYNEYKQRELQTAASAKGGDFYSNQLFRINPYFMRKIMEALDHGSIQYIEAFRLTNIYGNTFDKFAEKVMDTF
ncbi:MAG: ImmA/IrrE family metallo-endopeptidase [Candidatus Cloacimonadaceae bacterium]